MQANFGYGGYQDAMIGASFSLGGKDWAVSDFWGCFLRDDAGPAMFEVCGKVKDLLDAAKMNRMQDLGGIPIEATFDGLKLSSWRVLTEVL